MAPALVLLHGFTHTGASWAPVVAALGEERYRAHYPDIRGHGRASHAVPVTLEAVIADVQQLAPQRFTLAGYSMGGRLALHVALASPGRVERLVLVGASPGIADPSERAARARADEQLAAELEEMTIAEFAQRWGATPLLAGQREAVRRAAHEDRLRNEPRGLARALRGLGTGSLPSLWERLGELGCPVEMVVGERDVKFRQVAEAMLAALPRGRIHVVPGAGHAVHLEAPAALAAIITGTS